MTEQLFKKTLKALIDNKEQIDGIENSLQKTGLFDTDEHVFLNLRLTLSDELVKVISECNPFGVDKAEIEDILNWYIYESGEKIAEKFGKEYNLTAIDDFINHIKRLK